MISGSLATFDSSVTVSFIASTSYYSTFVSSLCSSGSNLVCLSAVLLVAVVFLPLAADLVAAAVAGCFLVPGFFLAIVQ